MGSLNKVFLIGRIGQEPEKKVTQSGSSVMEFSIATSERYTDKQGQKQEKTEWHRIVVWNKLADLIADFCHKGSQIYIEGALQTDEWQDKDGNKRYTTKIHGRQVQFLDSVKKEQQSGDGYAPVPNVQREGGPAPDFVEDDIPF